MPANYVIEARSYRLGIWSHNFWVLRDESLKCSLAELHGLAMSRVTGRIVPIGTTSEHGLRAYVFAHHEAYAETLGIKVMATRMFAESPAHPVYEGVDSFERWQAAVTAIPVMNEQDLAYPPWGFNFFGQTINSNSAYRTFAEIMGVEVYEFPDVVGPGIRNGMLPPEQTARLRFQPANTGQAATDHRAHRG